jgi:hypothetical protein
MIHKAIVSLLTLSVLLLGCACRRATSPISREDGDASQIVFRDEPISYCVEKPSSPDAGDVQVLIDGSGSMVGFDHKLPEVIKWSQHAVSAIQNSILTIGQSRICTFREKEGISGCTGMTGGAPLIKSKGDTNLHEAINSAKDYALTFIVTDGVAATGDKGKGDCATGVDAACVARSLVNAIHSDDSNDDRGLWIIPLVAPYDGPFFTEESIPPGGFHSEEAIQRVRSDIAMDASIQNPQTGYAGKLVYNYKGPRSLLLIVLAKKSNVGRAAIQALWERAEYLNINEVAEIRQYKGGIAALTPVELYPGFLNKVRWATLDDPDDPGASEGTLDAKLTKRDEKAAIEINCPNTGPNSATFVLRGSERPSQVAGCVPLRMMPGFSYDVRPARKEDDDAFHQFISRFRLPKGSYSSVELDILCAGDATRRCGQDPISVQLVALMHYGQAADRLAESTKPDAALAPFINLSTAHPSMEPHKINALSLIAELFYREIANDARSTVLNSFQVCKQ